MLFSDYIPDAFSCKDIAGGRRNKRDTSRGMSSVFGIKGGLFCFFGAEKDRLFFNSPFFKFLSDNSCQRTAAARGFGNIADPEFFREKAVSRSKTHKKLYSAFFAFFRDMEFCGYGIDCIDYIIRVPVIKKCGIFRKIKFFFIGNAAIRRNFFKTEPCGFDFIKSDRFGRCQKLAVYIRLVNRIAVNEQQISDARS